MKKFEYIVDNLSFLNTDEKQHELTCMGNDGWELVTIDFDRVAYFKREIIDEDGT